jgi:UTP--glucose-1-phosphate uridylyltransferase
VQLLKLVQNNPKPQVNGIFTLEDLRLSLGHSVPCVQSVMGTATFTVLLTDNLSVEATPITRQLVDADAETSSSVLAVQDVPGDETRQYGAIDGVGLNDPLVKVSKNIEWPVPEHVPSTLNVAGSYVLTPAIFDQLAEGRQGAGDEIQLTDAIDRLIRLGPVLSHCYDSRLDDCGSKLGLLQANVGLAEHYPEVGATFRHWLAQRQPLPAELSPARG